MNKQSSFLIRSIFGMLILLMALNGCGTSQSTTDAGTAATGTAATGTAATGTAATGTAATGTASTESTPAAQAPEQKIFTIEELAQYNGKNGNPAYIAIDGTVYDVTNVSQWKDGDHVGKFEAGKDFTNELKNMAPHDASKLQGVPVVGKLAD